MSPSTSKSSMPVAVMVWATFQSAGVNVRLAAETLPSDASLDATGITTSAVGWLVSTTVKLGGAPGSVGAKPAAGGAALKGAALFAVGGGPSGGLVPVYAGSPLLAGAWT